MKPPAGFFGMFFLSIQIVGFLKFTCRYVVIRAEGGGALPYDCTVIICGVWNAHNDMCVECVYVYVNQISKLGDKYPGRFEWWVVVLEYVCLHIALPHYHHTADVSEGIVLLKNVCQIHSVGCVPKIMSYFIKYMGFCVFSLPIYLMMIVRIHVLYLIIIIKSKIWPICHRLGFVHDIMVFAVYISTFL